MKSYIKFILAAVCLSAIGCSKDKAPEGPEGPGPDNFAGWESVVYRAFVNGSGNIQRDTFREKCQFTFNADQTIRRIIRSQNGNLQDKQGRVMDFTYKQGMLQYVNVQEFPGSSSWKTFFEYEKDRLVRLRTMSSLSTVRFLLQYNEEGNISQVLEDSHADMLSKYDWSDGNLWNSQYFYQPENGNLQLEDEIVYAYRSESSVNKMPFKSMAENLYVIRELFSNEMCLLSARDVNYYDYRYPSSPGLNYRKTHTFIYDNRGGSQPRRWMQWKINQQWYHKLGGFDPDKERVRYFTFIYND
ncbi:hypothetical protein ACQKLP_07015 [Chitinophaga sp. NPDC101104]|uniref:hypothetical protein n=1 Tax=Chitinophaga sp. NPDC101104 TaxID=3390561 RepID=UPI003D06B880